MRILFITLAFFMFSCQGNTSDIKTSVNQPQSEPIQEKKQVTIKNRLITESNYDDMTLQPGEDKEFKYQFTDFLK